VARHFGQLQRMERKIAELQEKAKWAETDRATDKYLRRADAILARIKNIRDNRRSFGERARGNTNRRGVPHSREARAKMSKARKEFWKTKAGFQKMWRARRIRQYREAGRCRQRYPRLPDSVDKRWLKTHRRNYKKIVGTVPELRLYPDGASD
jgi:hypothetical protein